MSFRDIVGIVLSVTIDEPVLAMLEAMAGGGARASAVLLHLEPDSVYTREGAVVSGPWAEVLESARQAFAKEKEALDARCKGAGIEARERIIPQGLDGAAARQLAQLADLTVMLRPIESWSQTWRNNLFEGVLFGSGRPVLLVPPEWSKGPIGRNIVIGWNGKREASRALADAAPLLDRAERVAVVAVNAKPGRAGEASGGDIVEFLARRGVKADLHDIEGLGLSEAEALVSEAQRCDADMIVIGGYGRPRLGEMIFGGVTRHLTLTAPVPLFLSH
jgi:nucleotide-binding universal stress UspA family protein